MPHPWLQGHPAHQECFTLPEEVHPVNAIQQALQENMGCILSGQAGVGPAREGAVKGLAVRLTWKQRRGEQVGVKR